MGNLLLIVFAFITLFLTNFLLVYVPTPLKTGAVSENKKIKIRFSVIKNFCYVFKRNLITLLRLSNHRWHCCHSFHLNFFLSHDFCFELSSRFGSSPSRDSSQHQSAMQEKSLKSCCSPSLRVLASLGGVNTGFSVVNSSSKLDTSSCPFCKTRSKHQQTHSGDLNKEH